MAGPNGSNKSGGGNGFNGGGLGLTTSKTWNGNTASGPAGGVATSYSTKSPTAGGYAANNFKSSENKSTIGSPGSNKSSGASAMAKSATKQSTPFDNTIKIKQLGKLPPNVVRKGTQYKKFGQVAPKTAAAVAKKKSGDMKSQISGLYGKKFDYGGPKSFPNDPVNNHIKDSAGGIGLYDNPNLGTLKSDKTNFGAYSGSNYNKDQSKVGK